MILTDLSKEFHPVPKSDTKNVKEHTKSPMKNVMKKKSSKLAKLEKERYSILTDNMRKCYICKAEKRDIHEIYKGCNRQISMKNGFCIPICGMCHYQTEIDPELDKDLKIRCQRKYEELHSRNSFIKLIGQSYIKEEKNDKNR